MLRWKRSLRKDKFEQDFADLIIKNRGIFDCKKELISMNKKKGKLTSSALVDTIFFQVRDTKLIQSHVNDLASMLDENPAVNEIEQKLIVVILKDRVFKGRKWFHQIFRKTKKNQTPKVANL